MTESFAGQIRQALIKLAPRGEIAYQEIVDELGIVIYKDKQRIYLAMRDFIKRGECEKIAPGVVRYTRPIDPHPAVKTRRMYRFIRANRNGTVTIADVVANCNVSESTASEYLNLLTRRGITRRLGADNRSPRFQMIHDPGPGLVRNEANAEKMRRLRHIKKQALEQLDLAGQTLVQATTALADARRAVDGMEVEDDSDEGL